MWTHHNSNIDVDSYITEALDAKARNLAQINQNENKQKLRELSCPLQAVSYLSLYKDYTDIIKNYYK
jgi:hypothetical protein